MTPDSHFSLLHFLLTLFLLHPSYVLSPSSFHVRNRFVLIGDLALIIVSVLGSFALRLDVSQLPFYFPAALMMCAVSLLVKVPVYFYFGLYRRLWLYASTSELRLITVAVTTASVLTSGIMLVLINIEFLQPGMPRSALGIDWLLSLVLIGGSRFALRILSEQSTFRQDWKSQTRPHHRRR
ncbi:MAG: hypothetical protein IPN58_05410 [Anaerolineales bacterium]|nr:hypothetical protein [Anaerolineales bacterium]